MLRLLNFRCSFCSNSLDETHFPASHWKRPRTNNVQERTNGETRRRSGVARVFPSEASPARLVGAVMCEQDEAWGESRHFSEQRTSEPCEDRPGPVAPSDERELRLMAEQAIRASLELADTMEAA